MRERRVPVQKSQQEIQAICQSLSDPWTSNVVAPDSASNPIISGEDKKVSLYLENLEMLWRLGAVTRQPQKVAVSKIECRTKYP